MLQINLKEDLSLVRERNISYHILGIEGFSTTLIKRNSLKTFERLFASLCDFCIPAILVKTSLAPINANWGTCQNTLKHEALCLSPKTFCGQGPSSTHFFLRSISITPATATEAAASNIPTPIRRRGVKLKPR